MKGTIHKMRRVVPFLVYLFAWILLSAGTLRAQPPVRNYTVKDNRMYVALGKAMSDRGIDSFARQYNLLDLALKKYVRGMLLDSLKILGWRVEIDNAEVFVISKPLFSLDNISNPADVIHFTQKDQFGGRFPVASPTIRYGYNRFRNKFPFAVKDSIVTFYLRGYNNARIVMLAGSFNNWKPDDLAMTATDSGWIASVKLRPGKFWYKFVVDGKWLADPDNQTNENDGLGNINSVYFMPNVVMRLDGYTNAKRVYLAGSFNNWDPAALAMTKTSTGWQMPVYLAEGTHTYRFVVDRKWMADPANPDGYPNEYGEMNSVLRVGKSFLFYMEGHQDARQVVLAGSFNGWRSDELYMKKTAGGWELPYTLGPGNYEYNFIIDGKWTASPAFEAGENASKNFYFVIQPNYTFRLKGFQDARTVYLAGDFNDWSPNTFAMKKLDGQWVLDMNLSIGKHSYKFIVDGKWILDPDNKLWEQNQYSTGNSVLWIEE